MDGEHDLCLEDPERIPERPNWHSRELDKLRLRNERPGGELAIEQNRKDSDVGLVAQSRALTQGCNCFARFLLATPFPFIDYVLRHSDISIRRSHRSQ